jgi:uncharacterized protein with HEPN domain
VTKDHSVYIRHIYDCVCWIKEYVQAGKEAFFQDRKTQDITNPKHANSIRTRPL